MNFFFDNNLPAQLAHGVGVLSKNEFDIGSVIHLSDRFPRNEKDTVWISALVADGAPWYVVSIDKFKKDHRAERQAISAAGHTVYVLDAQWSSQPYWGKAARFIHSVVAADTAARSTFLGRRLPGTLEAHVEDSLPSRLSGYAQKPTPATAATAFRVEAPRPNPGPRPAA